MKLYPVRFWNTSENAKMSHVKVEPFTSLADARKFRNSVTENEGVEAEVLDPVDFTLNKPGVIEAFQTGQKLMKESAFVQSR